MEATTRYQTQERAYPAAATTSRRFSILSMVTEWIPYKLWTQDQTDMEIAETGNAPKSEEVELAAGHRSRTSFYCH